MNMNTKLLAISALLLSSLSVGACATPSSDEPAASSENAIEEERDDAIEMKVEDLDGDDIEESFTSSRMHCGTGGCQWTIHLSRLGEAGEVFGKDIRPLPRGTDDEATGFFAYARGGMCYGSFVRYAYEGGRYVEKSSIDCNEVIKRPEGAPVAQFEMQCLDVIPPECKDLP